MHPELSGVTAKQEERALSFSLVSSNIKVKDWNFLSEASREKMRFCRKLFVLSKRC